MRTSPGTRCRHVVVPLASALVLASGLVGALALPASATPSTTELVGETPTLFTGASEPASGWTIPLAGAGSSNSNGACLSAGVSSAVSSIPACTTSSGSGSGGVLQLSTNGSSQVGSVFNSVSVPTSQGLDMSFESYQYDGSGADGISFALAAANPADPTPPATTGPVGGSLGYSANSNSGTNDGLPFGYLGFGLDVYGNFESSTYGGTGCSVTSAAAESVTVRGPGNGAAGYCILDTSGGLGAGALDDTSASATPAAAAVPVEVALNPSASATTMTLSNETVPAGDWAIAYKSLTSGGSWSERTGALPTTSNNAELAAVATANPTWFNSTTHLPYQLTFGWTASTGGSNEYHAVSGLKAASLNGQIPLLNLTNTDSEGTTLLSGSQVNYTLTPSLATSLNGTGDGGNESDPVTVTDTFPTGITPGTATGTGWSCTTTVQTVSCTDTSTSTVNAGSVIGSPITVPATVASNAAGTLTAVARMSSDDGEPTASDNSGTATAFTAGVSPVTQTYGSDVTLTASTLPSTAVGNVTFSAGGHTLCTATVSNGSASCATSSTLDATAYSVTAVYSGDANFGSSTETTSFTISQATQAIAFSSTSRPSPAAGESYSVAATGGGSANPVTFGVDPASTAGACSISGSTVHFTGTGTCTIDANQAGDTDYLAASEAQQSVAIGVGSQAISFTSTAPIAATYSGSNAQTYTVEASATSGLAVTYSIDSSSISGCSISGDTVSYGKSSGTCIIDVRQPGDSNYLAAGQVEQSFTIAKAAQAISITSTAPSGATYGVSNGQTYTVSATATSGLPVTYSIDSSSGAGCTISGDTVSYGGGTGTCIVDANQAGNGDYLAAGQAQQSFTIGAASPAVNATVAAVTGHSGSTEMSVGSGAYVKYVPMSGSTFTYVSTNGSTADYTAVAGSTVKYAATVTPNGSGNPVVLTVASSSTKGACVISGATVKFLASGTCVIDATQAGNGDYVTAQVEQIVVIKQSSEVKPAKAVRAVGSNPTSLPVSVSCARASCDGTANVTVARWVDGPHGYHWRHLVLGRTHFKLAKGKSYMLRLAVTAIGKIVVPDHLPFWTRESGRYRMTLTTVLDGGRPTYHSVYIKSVTALG